MTKERILILLSFIAIAFFAYRNCFDVFIPSDNFSELFAYATQGAGGITQNLSNGVLYISAFQIIYFFYGLFGTDPHGWIGLSVLLHSILSFLVFLITDELTRDLFKGRSKYLGIFSALLFLLSPYQTESVIWTPTCMAMLLSSFWTLLSAYCSIKYFATQKSSYLVLLYISFLFAVSSYECSFFLPFACIPIYAYMLLTDISDIKIKTFVLKIFLPLFGMVFFYFLVCKVFFGRWIIHGGGGEFDLQTNAFVLSEHLLKYLVKFFTLYRYWDLPSFGEWLQENHLDPLFIGGLLSIALAGSVLLILQLVKKNKEAGYLILAISLCFLFSLVPVLPLDTSFLKIIYSDRYGYLPSAFFYMGSSVGIFLLFRKGAFFSLPGLVILFWMLLNNTISVWKETNQYCYTLLKNYEPFMNEKQVYILNLPSYYNGVAAYRTGFLESIYFKYHKNIPEENVIVVSHSYMSSSADTSAVEKRNDKQFFVSVPPRKNPYFGSGGGWAQSYSNENFTVHYDTAKCSYLLSFSDSLPKNTLILQIVGTEWKKIEL